MPDVLPIRIDRTSTEPLYRQVEEWLRAAVDDGRLGPGTFVPGIRELARSLGVARITITTAYEQLAAEGYLEGQVGRGTRVTARPPGRTGPSGRPTPFRPFVRSEAPRPLAGTPPAPHVSRSTSADGDVIDLRLGRPTILDFAFATWERLLRDAVRELSRGASRGPAVERAADPGGDPVLREQLAGWLGSARGVAIPPERVFVTSGEWASLSTYLDALDGDGAEERAPDAARVADPGPTAYVEDPALPHVARLLAGRGRRIVPVPADADGIDAGRMPHRPASPDSPGRIAHVTAGWNPVAGGTLSDERREALLAWAGPLDRIVEDDRDGDLRFAGPPPAALAATGGRVALLRGLERDLFPGARIGLLAVPAADAPRVRTLLALEPRGPGAIEQRTLARFFEAGLFDRHRRRARHELAARQDVLVEAFARECRGRLIAAPALAGRVLLVRVADDRWTAGDVVSRARSVGLRLDSVAALRLLSGPDDVLAIGFGSATAVQLAEAGRRLGRLLGDRRDAPVPLSRGWMPPAMSGGSVRVGVRARP